MMPADKIYREHHVQSAAIVLRNNSVVKVRHTSETGDGQSGDNQVMTTSRTWKVMDKVDKKAKVVVPKDSDVREKYE